MADEIKSLEGLEAVAGGVSAAAVAMEAPREPVRDALGRSYATGKRKDAVARVWIKPGSGKVVVNGKPMNEYFARPVLQMILKQPFTVSGTEGQFDVMATVAGGGLSGQAGAVKHGVSKALQLYDPSLRGALKAAGFLTRSYVTEVSGGGLRRCGIAAFVDELIEFGLVACIAQALQEGFELLLLFFEPAQRVGLVGVKGGVAGVACGRAALKAGCCAAAGHAVAPNHIAE